MRKLIVILSIIGAVFAACEPYNQDSYQEYYVVESYLVANRQLPQVRLSTTAPIDQLYTFENVAVAGADVEIRLMNEAGSAIEDVFIYASDSAGIYQAVDTHKVIPLRTYQLLVTTPDNNEISASAIIPGAFTVSATMADTLVYQSTEQLEVEVSRSSYPGRQNIYLFNTISLNPVVENLTPLYRHFFEEDEAVLQESVNVSSGLLNAANFTENPDGSTTIRYPWIAVAFYGDNKIIATTVDDNVYDYIRTESVQLGGSTLSPGEIQNVKTNVAGGIGIFGALSADTIQTFIKPNPNLGF